MAEDLTPTPPTETSEARPTNPFGWRFGIAITALMLVLAAAVLGTVLLFDRDRPVAWSTFTPKADDPVDRANEIAAYVQGRFLVAPGQPVATVTGGEDVIPDLPGRLQVVATTDVNLGPLAFEYYAPGEEGLLFFKLCGPAGGCTLAADAPRPLLLAVYAREALELALHGLKRIDQAGGVIVELPTGFEPPATPGAPLSRPVFYFPKKKVQKLLDKPLSETFPTDPPLAPVFTGEDLGGAVDLVQNSLYRMEVVPSPDSTTITYKLSQFPPA